MYVGQHFNRQTTVFKIDNVTSSNNLGLLKKNELQILFLPQTKSQLTSMQTGEVNLVALVVAER